MVVLVFLGISSYMTLKGLFGQWRAGYLDPATHEVYVPVFWNIQMTVRPPKNPSPRFDAMLGLLCQADHPALKNFPTDKFCDWQWTSIIHNVPSVNLTSAPPDLRPPRRRRSCATKWPRPNAPPKWASTAS